MSGCGIYVHQCIQFRHFFLFLLGNGILLKIRLGVAVEYVLQEFVGVLLEILEICIRVILFLCPGRYVHFFCMICKITRAFII